MFLACILLVILLCGLHARPTTYYGPVNEDGKRIHIPVPHFCLGKQHVSCGSTAKHFKTLLKGLRECRKARPDELLCKLFAFLFPLPLFFLLQLSARSALAAFVFFFFQCVVGHAVTCGMCPLVCTR
uniref:Secreted protein n=1 Tax=Amblyomma cajennense TaxID=34607 RepID=A0A023FE21_AMBCJ